MTSVEVFSPASYAGEAAARLAEAIRGCSSVVLTGGRTAKLIYPALAAQDVEWSGIDVFFSDERCVPPDDEESNYRMASDLLLDRTGPRTVHRMRGEDDPISSAAGYDELLSRVEAGLDVVLLGLGGDCHIAGLFPGSPFVSERGRSCVAVDRPDGLQGLTLTPPPILGAGSIFVITHGASKAGAVERALYGDEQPAGCPARLLTKHTNVTFLLDEEAAGNR